MIWFFVDKDYLEQIGFGHVAGVTYVEMTHLIRREIGIFRLTVLFHDACLHETDPVPLYYEAKSTLLATYLLRAQFGGPTPIETAKVGLGHAALQKIQDYVKSKLAAAESRNYRTPVPPSRDDLSNAVLARVANLSEHHFIRQFKERTKRTPQEYVMQCRLDKAEELIVAHGYSPKEAAYAAGFCEPGHFYRRFRQRCGQSPHELLKQSRP